MSRDGSFGVMRFDFDLILTQFYSRNPITNTSKSNRITPKESSQYCIIEGKGRAPNSLCTFFMACIGDTDKGNIGKCPQYCLSFLEAQVILSGLFQGKGRARSSTKHVDSILTLVAQLVIFILLAN